MASPFDLHSFNGEYSEEELGRDNRFCSSFGIKALITGHKRSLLFPCVGFLLGASFPVRANMQKQLLLLLLSSLCVLGVVRTKLFRKGRLLNSSANGLRQSKSVIVLWVCVALCVGLLKAQTWTNKILLAEQMSKGAVSTPSGTVGIENAFVAIQAVSNPKPDQRQIVFTGKILGFIDPNSGELLDSDRSTNLCKGMLAKVSVSQTLRSAQIRYGNIVLVSGKLALPMRAKNPGEFDYSRYLLGQRIVLECKGRVRDSVQNTVQDTVQDTVQNMVQDIVRDQKQDKGIPEGTLPCFPGAFQVGLFQKISAFIEAKIDLVLPGEEKGILKALFLGDRAELSERDSASFRLSGLLRFVSIAGFHVTMIAALAESAVKRLTNTVHLPKVAALAAAWFWAGISGFSAGPLRAFICVLLKQSAFWARRKYESLSAALVSGMVIGTVVPYPLLDPAFQLTFAGMLCGIVAFEYSKGLVVRFRFGTVRRAILQSFLMAVLLFPMLAYHFEDVSLAGFCFSGLWAVAAVAALVSGALVIFFPLPVAKALSWLPFLVLRGLRQLGLKAAFLPLASLAVPAPRFLETVSYYGLVFLLLGTVNSRQDRRFSVFARTATPGLALILFVAVFFRYYIVFPQAVFLSVGQGDCSVIRTGFSVIVVDTGTKEAAERSLVPFLKRSGINRIDLCVLSHLHSDHAGGLQLLCNEFEVETIMTCPGSQESVADMIPDTCVEIIEAGKGEAYNMGSALIQVLHPMPWDYGSANSAKLLRPPIANSVAAGEGPGFSNEDSLVFTLVFQGLPGCFEFWGDATGKVVSNVQDSVQQISEAVVVKVPHHGSPESLVFGFYERFLTDSCQGAAVISVGQNSYGHPSPEVIESAKSNGVSVFRTDVNGAITVKVRRGGVRVKGFLATRAM